MCKVKIKPTDFWLIPVLMRYIIIVVPNNMFVYVILFHHRITRIERIFVFRQQKIFFIKSVKSAKSDDLF